MKIANIVGVRPQFIKYFPVSEAINKFNEHHTKGNIKDILIHTGQHYDYNMSKIFFDKFGIKEPDFHLGVGSGTYGEQTGKIVHKAENVLISEKPDIVVVYGDTNTTLGGALAAVKHQIPVAHVEAGLRVSDKTMPEEINRIFADNISTFLLCPSNTAVKNLKNEGFKNFMNGGEFISSSFFDGDNGKEEIRKNSQDPIVSNIGDVMYDVLLSAMKISRKQTDILKQLRLTTNNYYLLTLHRAENTDNIGNLEELIRFINNVSSDKDVIFPIHPRTKKNYKNAGIRFANNVKIIDPMDYFDILVLLKNCSLVLTDSGGLQKEAYWLKVPCITLRDETEWMETVKSGWNILYKDYTGSHNTSEVYESFYGDGKAAERIVCLINDGLDCI